MENQIVIIFRFDCSRLQTFSTNKCYLKDKTFNVGDHIADEYVPNCRTACMCDDRVGDVASVQCAAVECPEDFDYEPNVVKQYHNLTECCSSNTVSGR